MGFLSKLLRLLLKVTKDTKKSPKMGHNSIISFFFARRAKKASAEGRSPPQELEVEEEKISEKNLNFEDVY